MQPVELEAEIAQFCQSKDFKSVAEKLGYWAVVLVGPKEPFPARFGDNRGVIACRVGRTSNVTQFIKDANKNERNQNLVALHTVWVRTGQHATRLYEAMTILCLGENEENRHFRGFFDWTPNIGRWDDLVALAQAKIRARGEIVEVWSEDEMKRRVFDASRTPWRRRA